MLLSFAFPNHKQAVTVGLRPYTTGDQALIGGILCVIPLPSEQHSGCYLSLVLTLKGLSGCSAHWGPSPDVNTTGSLYLRITIPTSYPELGFCDL